MIHALYLLVGWIIAWRVFPSGRNSLMVLILWPLPIAAHLIYLIRGKYPWWTPF